MTPVLRRGGVVKQNFPMTGHDGVGGEDDFFYDVINGRPLNTRKVNDLAFHIA